MAIPVTRLKFYRWVRALGAIIEKGHSPDRLVKSLTYLWQQADYPRILPERAPWASSDLLSDPLVKLFVEWLRRQPFEEAAYWLATLYSRLVDPSTRLERAMFFTPPRLAERVIDSLQENGASLIDHKWHDPACGGSAFLVPLALRMKLVLGQTNLSAKEQLKRIERNLSGNDLDESLLGLSIALLQMALYPLIESSGYLPNFKMLNGDGLCPDRPQKYDVVICNPPYRKLHAREVERYRDSYKGIIEGQPNIYALFICQAVRSCRAGGVVGLLTPTSFLSGRSFSKLRKHLMQKVDVVQLDMLSNRASTFLDVLQETSITVLSVHAKQAGARVPDVGVNILSENGQFRAVGKCSLPKNGDPWPIPRSEGDAALSKLAAGCEHGLSDYGYTAKIGNLVGYRDKRKRFAELPANAGKDLVLPLVWATDIVPTGKFEHGRDQKIKRDAAFVRLLNSNEAGVVRQSAVLLQRLTSSDQRSRLIAAAVPSGWVKKYGGFVCENHVIVLEPGEGAAVSVATMAKILNTKVVDRVFRMISSASNVGVSELKKLKLPDPMAIKKAMQGGASVDEAVTRAFNLAGSAR